MAEPSSQPRSAAQDQHPQSLRLLFPAIRVLVWILLAAFAAPMFRRNQKNLPPKGPILVFANHLSNADPILVQWSAPRLLHFMTRRELFSWPVLGNILQWMRAFPITQRGADKEGIKRAIHLLTSGHAVCVFPEGGLSPSGDLQEILPGSALLVRKTGAPCVCVHISGTERLMPYAKTTPRFARAKLVATWGTPHTFPPNAKSEEITAWIAQELQRLKDTPT